MLGPAAEVMQSRNAKFLSHARNVFVVFINYDFVLFAFLDLVSLLLVVGCKENCHRKLNYSSYNEILCNTMYDNFK